MNLHLKILEWVIGPLALGYGSFMMLIVRRMYLNRVSAHERMDRIESELTRKYGHALKEFNVIKKDFAGHKVEIEHRLTKSLKIGDLENMINDIKKMKKNISDCQVANEREFNKFVRRDEFISIINFLGARIAEKEIITTNKNISDESA